MKTIAVNIISPTDKEFVMNILKALAQKNMIHLIQNKEVLKGKPMTETELDQLIEETENSRSLSVEEAKQYLNPRISTQLR